MHVGDTRQAFPPEIHPASAMTEQLAEALFGEPPEKVERTARCSKRMLGEFPRRQGFELQASQYTFSEECSRHPPQPLACSRNTPWLLAQKSSATGAL